MTTESNYEQQAIEEVAKEYDVDAEVLRIQMDVDPRYFCNNAEFKVGLVRERAQSLRLKAEVERLDQALQQGLCGMCNESPSNPVHGSGEGQHAFVTSLAEIMRLNAAVAYEAQRYAALEKQLSKPAKKSAPSARKRGSSAV
jgi:hypothetical protein